MLQRHLEAIQLFSLGLSGGEYCGVVAVVSSTGKRTSSMRTLQRAQSPMLREHPMANRAIQNPHQKFKVPAQDRLNRGGLIKCVFPKYVMDCVLSAISTMVVLSVLGAIRLALRF